MFLRLKAFVKAQCKLYQAKVPIFFSIFSIYNEYFFHIYLNNEYLCNIIHDLWFCNLRSRSAATKVPSRGGDLGEG